MVELLQLTNLGGLHNGAIGRGTKIGPAWTKLAAGIDSGIRVRLSILDAWLDHFPSPTTTQIADALMRSNSRCAQQTAVGPAQGSRLCP